MRAYRTIGGILLLLFVSLVIYIPLTHPEWQLFISTNNVNTESTVAQGSHNYPAQLNFTTTYFTRNTVDVNFHVADDNVNQRDTNSKDVEINLKKTTTLERKQKEVADDGKDQINLQNIEKNNEHSRIQRQQSQQDHNVEQLPITRQITNQDSNHRSDPTILNSSKLSVEYHNQTLSSVCTAAEKM